MSEVIRKRKEEIEIMKGFPRIGQRIMKSAIAVALCFLVSFLRGDAGIVFYSQLAALWCMQVYASNTRKNALQRLIGTVVGAAYGLVFLLVEKSWHVPAHVYPLLHAAFVSVMIIVVLYTTVLMQKKQASYFSCVVFLSIVVNHVGDRNPYLFVWNRFLDTVIGILIGILVNNFSLPRERRQDILFISGLDGTLQSPTGSLSDYCRVELNRMLDDGARFTFATMRTPASLMEALRDIRIKLPVIVMDGAALYDMENKEYVKVYVISNRMAQEVLSLVKEAGLQCFANVVVEDVLFIYYEQPQDEVVAALVQKLRRSPYRNYLMRKVPDTEQVVYFMLLYPKAVIEAFYGTLVEHGMTEKLKIIRYDSADYPGYAYMKIYNRNATKRNMTHQLQEMYGIEKTVRIGTVPGDCDVLVEEGDYNHVVHLLKKMYEPLRWHS